MTLFELSFAVSIFGSAIVGVVTGMFRGIVPAGFGLIAGPLIGLAAAACLMGVPTVLLARTRPTTGSGTPVQNALAGIVFIGGIVAAPSAWIATRLVEHQFSDWLQV